MLRNLGLRNLVPQRYLFPFEFPPSPLLKYEKQNIYYLKENITIIYSNTRAYKIVKIEHRIPRIELDVETILTDICNVLINTLK